MQTLIIDMNENIELLKQSAEAVKKGAIAVFATDTVYGIGTNALCKESVSKIFEIKKRPLNKPLPILFHSVEEAEKYVDFNKQAKNITSKFMPGALTVILNPKDAGLDIADKKQGLAFRIPAHKKLLEWLKEADCPLASTSANFSGEPACVLQNQAIKQFEGKADYILIDGNLLGTESTVLDLRHKKPLFLREGAVKKEDIENAAN